MRPQRILPSLLFGVTFLVAGCGPTQTPGAPPSAEPSSNENAPLTQTPLSTDEVVDQIFAGFEQEEPLGTSTGHITVSPILQVPGVVTVDSVTASSHSTQLRFKLFTTEPGEVSVDYHMFNEFSPLTTDIRDVALENEAQGIRLLPLLGTGQNDLANKERFCICSDSPKTVDEHGVTLDATFAPLPQGTSTITVDIPGFDAIENIPVSWKQP